jgi:hypothetical protein
LLYLVSPPFSLLSLPISLFTTLHFGL